MYTYVYIYICVYIGIVIHIGVSNRAGWGGVHCFRLAANVSRDAPQRNDMYIYTSIDMCIYIHIGVSNRAGWCQLPPHLQGSSQCPAAQRYVYICVCIYMYRYKYTRLE